VVARPSLIPKHQAAECFLGPRPRPVSVAHSTGPMSPASVKSQETYGRPVCARQALAPAGHAGLSDAPRTVALVPRWEVTAALLIPGAHQVPARAMRQIMRERERVLKKIFRLS
jgi:hypothetical protein